MKLKELVPIIHDDCVMHIYRNDKRVYAETKLRYKPYTIEANRNKFIDDCEVDYILGEDLDEIIIELY